MARAYDQAQKFGAEMAIPDEVGKLNMQTNAGCFRLIWPVLNRFGLGP